MCPMYMQIDNAAATVIKECLVEDLTQKPSFIFFTSSSLQIFLYYNDLEVCNPLGSKAKIHKLSMYL